MSNIKQGYKQTDIGVIPEDWEIAELGEISKYQGGSQPDISFFSTRKYNSYIRLIQIRDYKTDKYTVYIPEALARRKCNKDDIMIGRYGPPIFQILKGLEGAYNVALIKAIPDQNIDKSFFYFTLKRNDLFQLIELLSRRSSGQTGVDLVGLKSFKIGLPSKGEQTAIATALSDTDALIASLDKKIAKKQQIKQGAMQQLLTGKNRLPGFSGEWVEKTYNDIFQRIPSKKYQINTDQYLDYGKYKIIDQGKTDFVGYTNDESKLFHSNEEGVIIFGDHTRIIKYSNFNFVVGADGVQLLSCKHGFSTKFVYYILTVFEVPNTGYNRHFKFLKELICLFPQNKSEQTAIAQILTDMDNEIAQLEKERDKYKELKAGMMQVLLTGKVRLV